MSLVKQDNDRAGNKKRGALYEAAFNYYAQRTGAEVFLSQGDHSVVDAVVISEMGKLYRVQIKGTTQTKVVGVKITKGKQGKILHENEYDVLAVYAQAYDAWYLIPSNMVNTRKTLKVFPMFPDSTGQYEVYREHWKIFK